MIKALLLIFDPTATWEGIARARRSLLFLLVVYLLPMVLLASAAEGYGLVHWGKWQGELGRIKKFPVIEAAIVEAAQLVLGLGVVFLGASMVKAVGDTFHGRHTYVQAFTTVAYSLSPLFLLRLLDAFNWVHPMVSWAIGIILSIAVLYNGLPRIMEPAPPHAFGLFLVSALLLLLVTGLVRLGTASFLLGKFARLQVIVSDVAARLQ